MPRTTALQAAGSVMHAYRIVKVKKEKKPKHWERDDDDRGQGDDDKGRHGKGHKQKD